jgi:hypothetical protein
MVKIERVSPQASKEVFTVGDEVVNISDLKVCKSTDRLGHKTFSLGADTFDKRIRFSMNEHMEVDTSVVIFAGKPKEDKVVCSTESIKPGYVIYKAGSEELHAFPIIVHTKKNGELGFSVVPKDKTENIMESHEKMKVDLHMHGIKIDKEGFYDLNGVRKLLELFDKSFSSDPKMRAQSIDLTKWELGIANPKEATKRMKLTLEIILQDSYGISKVVEIAEQASESANNPAVRRLIPDPTLPTFYQAGGLR